jgi:beta-phosphoglucomutase
MSIRAVVFDMDGVLVDAREWHYEALNRALGHFGTAISRFDHLVTYDGLPTRAKLEMLTRENALPRDLHAFVGELKQAYTMELIWQHCKPVFQHEYALSRLKLDGFLLGLASNSIRSTIEEMMRKAALLQHLDVLMSNEDVTHGKPDPEIYVKAMAALGVQPSEVLVVEDNEKGVRAAKAAGAHVLQVKEPADVTYTLIAAEIAHLAGTPAGPPAQTGARS